MKTISFTLLLTIVRFSGFAWAAGQSTQDRETVWSEFNASPSAFPIRNVKAIKLGIAPDTAIGQGRNAVYFTPQGWKVTGFHIFKEAMAATQVHTAKAQKRRFSW
jgi:hypothetical protein